MVPEQRLRLSPWASVIVVYFPVAVVERRHHQPPYTYAGRAVMLRLTTRSDWVYGTGTIVQLFFVAA